MGPAAVVGCAAGTVMIQAHKLAAAQNAECHCHLFNSCWSSHQPRLPQASTTPMRVDVNRHPHTPLPAHRAGLHFHCRHVAAMRCQPVGKPLPLCCLLRHCILAAAIDVAALDGICVCWCGGQAPAQRRCCCGSSCGNSCCCCRCAIAAAAASRTTCCTGAVGLSCCCCCC